MKSYILSKIYELDDVEDPIEVIVDYGPQGAEAIMTKGHDEAIGQEGITITGHGSGSVWLTWEELPELIATLQTALKERPLPKGA